MSGIFSIARTPGQTLVDIFFLDALGVVVPLEHIPKPAQWAASLDGVLSSER